MINTWMGAAVVRSISNRRMEGLLHVSSNERSLYPPRGCRLKSVCGKRVKKMAGKNYSRQNLIRIRSTLGSDVEGPCADPALSGRSATEEDRKNWEELQACTLRTLPSMLSPDGDLNCRRPFGRQSKC